MKKIVGSIVMAAMVFGLMGCFVDDNTKEKAKELTFDNQSRYTVEVIPLTIEFTAFYMASGERRTFKDIANPDFRYEPTWKVAEGSESTDRYVVFVDALPGSE